ncbi:MAG TPA: hypothetical protein VN455_13300, partial [Methanotrichaceae archaeon]|nr:hypothetical protein [Methanotrichaceae archaeon]
MQSSQKLKESLKRFKDSFHIDSDFSNYAIFSSRVKQFYDFLESEPILRDNIGQLAYKHTSMEQIAERIVRDHIPLLEGFEDRAKNAAIAYYILKKC